MCDYQGYEFGATYLDSMCIDGYLWDADSCDEPGGALRHGGDIPCPQCNHDEWLEYAFEEDVTVMGYEAAENFYERGTVPTHPFNAHEFALRKYPNDWIRLELFWRRGFNDYLEENFTLQTA